MSTLSTIYGDLLKLSFLCACMCDPQLSKNHSWIKERIDQEEEENTKQDKDQSEVVQKRITEWAKEIQSVSEVGQQKYRYILSRAMVYYLLLLTH